MSSPFVVGIDLGTTNCALAYVDMTIASKNGQRAAQILSIPQWETVDSTVVSDTLPSFYWLPVKAEFKRGQLRLPWHAPDSEPPDFAVGRLARMQAGVVPGRVIHSAKSWLSHAGVSRRERILPWHSDDIVGNDRRSPVEVSAALLAQLKDAWNYAMAEGQPARRLEAQEVIITVPASFDEAAQRLTLEAAILAGLPRDHIRLLEEPQAAFFEWLARGQDQKAQLQALLASHGGKPLRVLVCDIGGGTTDFSTFDVALNEPSVAKEPQSLHERLNIKRVAVSQHLLLGGDNIDLALAHQLEPQLVGAGKSLSSRQWAQLVVQARSLKERALSHEGAADGDASYHVALAGEGSSLFGNTLTASITADDIINFVSTAFFPACDRDAKPQTRRLGLSDWGLPYAQDAAISRHLAAFLAGEAVDAILFAGGSLNPAFLQERIRDLVGTWQGYLPAVLTSSALDLAVALGAAYAGAVGRDDSLKIRGGYPRSLYLAAARAASGSPAALVCVVPKGFEIGDTLVVDQLELKAVVGRPAQFQLFSSTERPQDRPGTIVELHGGDDFHALPPLHTRLDGQGLTAGTLVDVALDAQITATGLLELHLVHRGPLPQRWQLAFDVRAIQPRDEALSEQRCAAVVPDSDGLAVAINKINQVYGKRSAKDLSPEGNPKSLIKDLEQELGRPREAWDGAFLRALWPTIQAGANRRSRSLQHEATWLWLAGFALRPGYGFELDEWRVGELWSVFQHGMSFPKERQVEDQWWILWRRVAGGLNRQQQEKIFDKIFPALRQETASSELYMLAASLERVDMNRRLRLGNQLVQPIAAGRKQQLDQRIWALARVASRVPLYGGPEAIVRPKFVGDWLAQVESVDYPKLTMLYSQAARMLGDREFDLSEETRERAQKRLVVLRAPEELVQVTREVVAVDEQTQNRLFGESLPAGLVLM